MAKFESSNPHLPALASIEPMPEPYQRLDVPAV